MKRSLRSLGSGRLPTLLTLLGGIGLSAVLLVALLRREDERQWTDLREAAKGRSDVLHTQVLRSLEVLHGVAALYATRGQLTRHEFQVFVHEALDRQPELQGLAWDAFVPGPQRADYEDQAHAEGYPSFEFTDEGPHGAPVRAPERHEYFPVFYLEPLEKNLDAFGFDVGSEPKRRAALEAARDSGKPVATAPVRLAQEKDVQLGFLVFEPVYRGADGTLALRRAHLAGFAVAVFRTGDLVEKSPQGPWLSEFSLSLVDDASGIVMHRQGRSRAGAKTYVEKFEIAGRQWQLALQPMRNRFGQSGVITAWAAFGAGLAITALVVAYLLSRERGARNLAQSNAAMLQEIAVRKEAEAVAESASRAKSEFLANMSHEIRTPMNAILGYTQILARDGGLHPFQRDAIATIGSSCDHLLHLIDEILDLSKIDAGRMELTATDFDLAALLRELICLFQPQCEEKKLGLRYEGPPSDLPLLVRGDEGKLRQVLINLLGNAVKFTDAGRVTLHASALDADHWRFAVEDTGAGIAPEEFRAAVFQPFRQGAPAVGQGGAGLGLTIARRQVELMGGRLDLETGPAAGSRFFFSLQLTRTAGRLDAAVPKIRQVDRLAEGSRVRALVVDDIPENREVLAILLRVVGCEVGLAENGRQALEIVRFSRPDIVFLDMRLPDLEGAEAARRLIHEFGPSGLKIVATSASALTHQREQYLEVGCDEFVAKPFRAERIYASLERLLHVRFEYRHEPEPGEPGEIVDLSSITLPEDLATRLMMAAELHSATVLKACLHEVEALGPAGQRFAHHLRVFLASYDMATIQRLVAQIPVHTADQHTAAA